MNRNPIKTITNKQATALASKGVAMSDETKGYQGWANYETWLVALWLSNEQASHEYWLEAAQEALENPKPNPFSDHDMTAYHLGERMKGELDDDAELPTLPGFYADLLNAALSSVNWREIAERYLDDAKQESGDKFDEQV